MISRLVRVQKELVVKKKKKKKQASSCFASLRALNQFLISRLQR